DASDRNGDVVKLCLVRDKDQVMVITDQGQVIRTRVAEIRETGRNAQGVRVIRLQEGERVVDVEPFAESESEGGSGTSVPPPPDGDGNGGGTSMPPPDTSDAK